MTTAQRRRPKVCQGTSSGQDHNHSDIQNVQTARVAMMPIGTIASWVLAFFGPRSTRFCMSEWLWSLTGLVPWQTLVDDAAPVVNTLKKLHFGGVRLVVLIGALMGHDLVPLVFQIGQARVWYAMSRDGLLPRIFSRVHPRFCTPDFSTWMAGFLVGIPAGLLDIGTFADLSNIGTLFAFALVAAGVLILRYREPNRPRAFRAPAALSRQSSPS